MNYAHARAIADEKLVSEDGISRTYRRPATHHDCDKGEDYIVMVSGEVIRIGLRTYQIGSVASCALASGDCPIEAVENAKARGHKLHFAFGRAAIISDTRRDPGKAIELAINDRIHFEGRNFQICAAPNHNIDLIEV